MSTRKIGIDLSGEVSTAVAEMCSVRLDKRLFGVPITTSSRSWDEQARCQCRLRLASWAALCTIAARC